MWPLEQTLTVSYQLSRGQPRWSRPRGLSQLGEVKVKSRQVRIPKGLNVTDGSLRRAPCLDSVGRWAPTNTPLSESTEFTQSISTADWHRTASRALGKVKAALMKSCTLRSPSSTSHPLVLLLLLGSCWTTYQSWLFWATSPSSVTQSFIVISALWDQLWGLVVKRSLSYCKKKIKYKFAELQLAETRCLLRG